MLTGPQSSLGASQDALATRPTSGAASRTPTASRTAGREETVSVSRVLRVQLAGLSEAQWIELRALAREGAQFANRCLADSYARALGYTPPANVSIFRRAKGSLSGDVRVALAREAFTAWRKHGSRILSGAQRLALFDADRALVCRAEHLSKGRRQIHARVTCDESDHFALTARLKGKQSGDRHRFGVWTPPQTETYVRPVLEALAAGDTRLLKVTFIFERNRGRKVFALLTYARRMAATVSGTGVATLGPIELDGSLWLRWTDAQERAQTLNLTGWIGRLVTMKLHYGGIQRRLRARMRRSGLGHRRAYRMALIKAGSFGGWAPGVLHQLSALIVGTLQQAGCGALAIGPLEYQDLPMAQFVAQLTYKSQDVGMTLTRFDPVDQTTARAIARPIAKRARRLQQQRQAVQVLREGLMERSIT